MFLLSKFTVIEEITTPYDATNTNKRIKLNNKHLLIFKEIAYVWGFKVSFYVSTKTISEF